MVVRPGRIRVPGNERTAPDQADNPRAVLLSDSLPVEVEDEPHQVAVLLHLVPQALRVVAVALHVAVKGLHLGCPVEGVVAIPGLVIHQQVTSVVVPEGLCNN